MFKATEQVSAKTGSGFWSYTISPGSCSPTGGFLHLPPGSMLTHQPLGGMGSNKGQTLCQARLYPCSRLRSQSHEPQGASCAVMEPQHLHRCSPSARVAHPALSIIPNTRSLYQESDVWLLQELVRGPLPPPSRPRDLGAKQDDCLDSAFWGWGSSGTDRSRLKEEMLCWGLV